MYHLEIVTHFPGAHIPPFGTCWGGRRALSGAVRAEVWGPAWSASTLIICHSSPTLQWRDTVWKDDLLGGGGAVVGSYQWLLGWWRLPQELGVGSHCSPSCRLPHVPTKCQSLFQAMDSQCSVWRQPSSQSWTHLGDSADSGSSKRWLLLGWHGGWAQSSSGGSPELQVVRHPTCPPLGSDHGISSMAKSSTRGAN